MTDPQGAPDSPKVVPEAPPAEGAVLEVEHYELDDIPLFHLPMTGATILTLTFRVGRADEPVPLGGMTHLFEHLVMNTVSDALDHSNGMTGPFQVSFTLRGTPEAAARFLRDVCRAIETPKYSRIHEEANVLRTEAAGRQGMGISQRMIWFRTGYQGIGTMSIPELFLRSLDEDALREWVTKYFVAGNAVIWIAGDIPDDLLVALPAGDRQAPPETARIPGFQTPVLVQDGIPGVGASFVVERSAAVTAGFRTVDQHLKRALRVNRGLAYDVGADYLPVSATQAVANVRATCLPAVVPEVEKVLLETIDDLAARGPSDDELAEQSQKMARDLLDPLSIAGRLDAHARDVLFGKEPGSAAELVDEQWALHSDDVARAFREARDSMLFVVPPVGRRPQRHFERYPGPTMYPAGDGRSFEFISTKHDVPWARSKSPRLTVGALGLTIDSANGRRMIGIRWQDVVAVVRDPDVRMVLSRDGSSLRIGGSDWKGGRDALPLIDRVAPPTLLVG